MEYDSQSEYGVVPIAYRSPNSVNDLPDMAHDSPQARAKIPQKPGYGTLSTKLGRPRFHDVMMLNGRTLHEHGEQPSFDRHSFMFAHQRLQFTGDWEDIADVRDNYLPEVEALVRQTVPGANHPDAKVLIFDHAIRTHLRNVKKKNLESSSHGWGVYANTAHTDATVRSIHTRCKDQVMGTNETEIKYQGKYPSCWRDVRPTREWQEKLFRAETEDHNFPNGQGGEHMIVNVWRPIQPTPVKQWGLCALDGSTLRQGDVHPTQLVQFDNTPGGRTGGAVQKTGSQVFDLDGHAVPVRIGEVLSPLHEPHHRWIYYPEMTRDECLLLKVFDSRRDGRTRCGCHCAFKDPHGDPDAHRESIETRCLVILPKGVETVPTFATNESKL